MIVLYILLGVIGLIVILLLIALLNTFMVKERDFGNKKELDIDLSEAYGLKFQEMIKIKTISYDETLDNFEPFVALKTKMKELFPNVFKVMEIKEFKGESLILKWKGKKDHKPLVLMSHIDVVPAVDSSWDYEPFKGEIVNGEIYG